MIELIFKNLFNWFIIIINMRRKANPANTKWINTERENAPSPRGGDQTEFGNQRLG